MKDQPADTLEALEMEFRHSGQAGRRWRIRKALEKIEGNEGRLVRWDECGRFATVEESQDRPGTYRLTCSRCRDRFCPTCAIERSKTIAANVAEKIDRRPHRFITLTVRHGKEDLDTLLTKLEDGFKKLRRSRVWKTAVVGGVAFLEVKKSNGWHPHLHIVVQGNYMVHRDLCEAWLKATGDSNVVDIKLIRDAANTVAYVTKYASKPLDRSIVNDEKNLLEAIQTLKGRKMMQTFGDWRGTKLTEAAGDEAWQTVASLQQMLEREMMGDPEASKIMNALRSQAQWKREREVQSESRGDG